LTERFKWLLQSPGLGLITGEPGVGKTAALRNQTKALSPHQYQVINQVETDFGRVDIYRSLARALGVEPGYRRAHLWREWTKRSSNGWQVVPSRHARQVIDDQEGRTS